MKRETYRMLDGKLVPISQWYAAQPARARSGLPCPAIRVDGMAPTINHADGRVYESRSAYDAALRASGHHIVEAGEMTGGPKVMEAVSEEPMEQSIKTAIEQLEGRV